MKLKKILLVSSLVLVISGCGKDVVNKEASTKHVENNKKIATLNTKDTSNSSEKKVNTDDKEVKNTDQQKNANNTINAESGTSNTTNSTKSVSNSNTTTATKPTTTTTATKPTTTATKPTTTTTPTTPPPTTIKPDQITFDTLAKFDNRASNYTSVEESQLSPLQLGNYSNTPIAGSILLEMATFRASLDEMRSTIIGKADGNYKVTGVYSYTVTIPYLQTGYTTEEWNHGTYFYDKAKAAGLFDATFSGTRFDRVRGVIDVNNLEAGMKVTRVVITFEKL